MQGRHSQLWEQPLQRKVQGVELALGVAGLGRCPLREPWQVLEFGQSWILKALSCGMWRDWGQEALKRRRGTEVPDSAQSSQCGQHHTTAGHQRVL